MKRVALITCSAQKQATKTNAENLYCSERFAMARNLAKDFADSWYVLSAKHGLVPPDVILEPYDVCLNSLSKTARVEWGRKIIQSLKHSVSLNSQLCFLGDSDYFNILREGLRKIWPNVYAPLVRLPKREEVEWLKMAQKKSARRRDLDKFYSLLRQLDSGVSSARQFGMCSGSLSWPSKGIYFFLDPSETRLLLPETPRVIRVGTHAVSEGSKSSLWQRLKTHKGNADGSGNHRSSIFRCHIGTAILKRENRAIPTWGDLPSSDPAVQTQEAELEQKVSAYLREMRVLWLDIADAPSKFSDRAYLEQNIIALLSGPGGPIDVASENWFGYDCANPAVRRSALWNVNYTDFEYDPNFFNVLKHYIEATLGKREVPQNSIAPKDWYESMQSGYKQGFLNILP